VVTSAPPAAERDGRPLRRDAERNRQRILDAAEELFAARGLSVTLNEVAHHAGVGVGTVYRRFADKAQLVEALFERRVEELVELMEQAVAEPDPWVGLTSFLESSLEVQARNSALRDLLLSTPEGFEHLGRITARLHPLGEQLMRRARASGQLREDVQASDLAILQAMLGAVIDGARGIDDQLWRRFLQLVLQALSADRDAAVPLKHPELDIAYVDRVLAACKQR
jgi:AcrR family transcriptional regulator